MNAFSAALTAIFADPNISVAAEYRSGGADPAVALRVVRRAPDQVQEFNAGRFVRDAIFLDVRITDAPDLAPGDTFTIEGELFEVMGEPFRDSERLVWKAEARDVA